MSKKLLLSAALALVALYAVASSASAASFEIRPGGAIRAISSGKVLFETELANIECNLTLEGNLRTGVINKVAGAQIGEVTRVNWANCSGGNVRTVLNVPWRLTFNSIAGTLPNAVTSVLFSVNNAQFQFSVFFGLVNCLYAGNVGAALGVSGSNPYTTGTIRTLTSPSIPFSSGPEACPAAGTMTGTFSLTSQTITRT